MDLMNLDNEKFVEKKYESYIDPDLFIPDPNKGQNGAYKAIGRFVPYWINPDLSKYKKDKVVLKNQLSKDFLRVDCPSSIGKPSVLFALDRLIKERERAKQDESLVKELKEQFSRYSAHYSPFYIHKDPQFPVNDNKLKIVEFGFQIDRMIQKLLNPVEAELGMDIPTMAEVKKINPYSLIDGKDFLWLVKKKSKRFKDYDGCKFMDGDTTPFIFMYNGERHVVTKDELVLMQQGQETPLSKFLKANTPDMTKYYYKEWTEDTYKQVASYLKAIIPYKQLMTELIDSCRDLKMRNMLSAQVDISIIVPGVQQPIVHPQTTTPIMPQVVQTQAQPVAQQNIAAPAVQPTVQEPPVVQNTPVIQEDEFEKMLKGL